MIKIIPKNHADYEAIKYTGTNSEHWHDFVDFVTKMRGMNTVQPYFYVGADAAMLKVRDDGDVNHYILLPGRYIVTMNGFFHEILDEYDYRKNYEEVDDDVT